MKKAFLAVILVFAVLMFLTSVAFADAESTTRGIYKTPSPYLTNILNKNTCFLHTHEYNPYQTRLVVGAKADLPNLVRFTKNSTLGLEGGKDLYNDPFMDSGRATEDDKGYFAYVKYTYTGTIPWLDFSD